jgi:hypothetical protein
MKPLVVYADPVIPIYVKPLVAQNVRAENIEREDLDIERNNEIINIRNIRTNAIDLQYSYSSFKIKNALFHLSFLIIEMILLTKEKRTSCIYEGNTFSTFFIVWIIYDIYNFFMILLIERGTILRRIIHYSLPQEYYISLQKYIGLHVFVNIILTSGFTSFYLYYKRDVCYGTIGLYIDFSLMLKLSIYYFRLFLVNLHYLRYKFSLLFLP